MLLSLVPAVGVTATATEASNVEYIDAAGTEQSSPAATAVDGTTTVLTAGRYVVGNDVTPSIAVGATSDKAEYGTASTSVYELTAEYVSGTDWSIQWYKGGSAIDEAPASYSVSGNMLYIDYNGTADAGEYKFVLSCDGVTGNEAVFTVGKRTAKIISGTAAKVYDGTPLTCETYEATGFLDGEGVYVTCTGTITDVGTEPNYFTCTAREGTNLDNYEITEQFGVLKVSGTLFVISAGNYSAVYDGKEHKFNNEADGTAVKITAKNGIDYTDSISAIKYTFSTLVEPWSNWSDDAPSIKNAGTMFVKMQVTATVNGQTVTLNSDTYTMSVTKKNVVLTSGSKQREYNGSALTYDDVCYGALAGGESFSPEPVATGTITNVGSTPNTIDITNLHVKADSVDTTANYTFSKVEGTLTVTPKSTPITITTPSGTKKYDGQVINAGTATSNFDDVKATSDILTVTLYRTGSDAVKDAGTYANEIATYKVENDDGADVTKCYTFAEPEIGTLTITPRQVTLASGSDTRFKTSEGDKAFNANVSVTGDGLVAGEELDYSDFPTVNAVSCTPTKNTFTYAADPESAFNPNNYDITVEAGYLMLVDEMSIIADNRTFTYDGTKHEAPITVVDNGMGADVIVTYSTSEDGISYSEYTGTVPSITDAGTLYVKVKATKGAQTKEGRYTVTVEKRNVVIATDSATMTYTGSALTASGYTFSGQGFVNDDSATVTVTGTQTYVGNSLNNFTYTLNSGVDANNYNITEQPGTLTVKPNTNTITITTGSSTFAYSGMALACSDWSATFGSAKIKPGDGAATVELSTGDTLFVCCTGKITDVGSVENTCTYRVQNSAGIDVTACYTFAKLVCGTLTVTPRNVVISTGSAAKVYDGTALTNTNYTLSGDGFVSGEGFDTVNVAGTRTNAGTSENVLDETTPYTFKSGTKAENYKVTVAPGTLTVSKRRVTVSSGCAVSIYGATPGAGLTNDYKCNVSGDGFVAGEMADGYPKGVGKLEKGASEPATAEQSFNYIEYKWAGAGNPANYLITENRGTLCILNNNDNMVVTADYVGVYDGKPHTGTFAYSIMDPNKIEYSTDGGDSFSESEPTFTDVGSCEVIVKITKGSSCVQSLYTVTINPRTLILESGSATKVYDGTELRCDDYIVGGDGFVTGEEQTITMNENSCVQNVSKANNKINGLCDNGNFKTSNYKISYIYGKLTVTKRQLILYSNSIEGFYTGNEYKDETVNVGGLGFAGSENAIYSGFGSFTNVNNYMNAFKVKWGEGTNKNNYDYKIIFGNVNITSHDPKVSVDESLEGKWFKDGESVTVSGTVTVAPDSSIASMTISGIGETPVTVTATQQGETNVYDWTYTYASVKDTADTTLTIAATDTEGYTGTATYTLKVDTAKPTITVTATEGYTQTVGEGEAAYVLNWYKKGATATISATIADATSGVNCSYYNDESYTSGNSNTLSTGSELTFEKCDTFAVTDDAGNSASANYYYNVDGTAPTIGRHSVSNAYESAANCYWVGKDTEVVVAVNVTDAKSGIKEVKFGGTAVNGTESVYSTTYDTTAEAAQADYKISVEDNVGNTDEMTLKIGVDGAGPEISDNEPNLTSPTAKLTVKVNANDAASGVNASETKVQVGDGEKVAYTPNDKYEVNANGKITFYFYDNVGNESTKEYTITNIVDIDGNDEEKIENIYAKANAVQAITDINIGTDMVFAFNGTGAVAAESESIEEVLGAIGFVDIKLTGIKFDVEATEADAESKIVTYKFNVTPYTALRTKAETPLTANITFRLPLNNPDDFTYANVYHEGSFLKQVTLGDNDTYIEVTAKEYSEYSYTLTNTVRYLGSAIKKAAEEEEEEETTNNPFVDVNEANYFYDAVLWAVENGVTSGVDDTHFNPAGVTTRAQMVTFLWRAAGSPEPTATECAFTDVSADAYYYKAVLWAVENGITTGTSDTTFAPNAAVTRAQAVTFLWRRDGSIMFTNMTATGPAAGPFTDVTSSSYYYSAVLWAKTQGITSGVTDTTFAPNDTCTRGQIVTFLYRAVDEAEAE